MEIQARTGDLRLPAAAADHVLALATHAGAGKEIAQTYRALGVVFCSSGDSSTAAKHFAEALRRYQELGTRWEVARTLHDWGRAEFKSADSGSRDRAREMLGRALAIFREFAPELNSFIAVHAE